MTRIIRRTLPRANPFGTDEWFKVLRSTHVAAFGLQGRDLIVGQSVQEVVFDTKGQGRDFIVNLSSVLGEIQN